MSNVIRFLELLGRDMGAGAARSTDFVAGVAALEIEPGLRRALIDGDEAAISRLLGGRESMMMLLAPTEPGNQEPDGEDAPDAEIGIAA